MLVLGKVEHLFHAVGVGRVDSRLAVVQGVTVVAVVIAESDHP